MTSERLLSYLGLIILTGLIVAVSVLKPGSTALLPPCPFHALTGLFCPGCGVTRMFYHLVHGDPVIAFRQNPLAFVFMPFVVAGLVFGSLPPGLSAQVSRRLPTASLSTWRYPLIIGLFVVVIVYTIARNIPAQPFCALAPGGC